MELWQCLEDAKRELYQSIEEMREWGLKRAKAEHDYKVVLKQKVLEEKAKGTAIGIIDKTCYGIEEVASARLQRDIADTQYEVAQEKVNANKLAIRVLDSQMSREWSVQNE